MPLAIHGETWRTFSPERRVQTAGWMARGRSSYSVITSMAPGGRLRPRRSRRAGRTGGCRGSRPSRRSPLALDPVAHLGRDRVVEGDAVDEAGHAAVGRDLDGAQHAGPVELVVVAVVEVPRQPLRQQLDRRPRRRPASFGSWRISMTPSMSSPPARGVALLGWSLSGPNTVLIATCIFGRRLDVLEDQQPALLEGLVELVAARRRRARSSRVTPRDAGAEGEVVADRVARSWWSWSAPPQRSSSPPIVRSAQSTSCGTSSGQRTKSEPVLLDGGSTLVPLVVAPRRLDQLGARQAGGRAPRRWRGCATCRTRRCGTRGSGRARRATSSSSSPGTSESSHGQ